MLSRLLIAAGFILSAGIFTLVACTAAADADQHGAIGMLVIVVSLMVKFIHADVTDNDDGCSPLPRKNRFVDSSLTPSGGGDK